jgi:hypothetical protein
VRVTRNAGNCSFRKYDRLRLRRGARGAPTASAADCSIVAVAGASSVVIAMQILMHQLPEAL